MSTLKLVNKKHDTTMTYTCQFCSSTAVRKQLGLNVCEQHSTAGKHNQHIFDYIADQHKQRQESINNGALYGD